MTSSPVPGWYQDPADANSVRYWDGAAWTHQVQPRPVAPPVAPPPPPAQSVPSASPFGVGQPAAPEAAQPQAPQSGAQPQEPTMFDLSGRPIETPPAVANPPLAPGQVNPGFGVIGIPGQDAFDPATSKGTAADVFASYTATPSWAYVPEQPGSDWGRTPFNPNMPGATGDYRFVGPIRAIGLGFRKYAKFTGRSSRSEFWWWFLFWYLVMIAFGTGLTLFLGRLIRIDCYGQSLSNCHANLTPLWVYSALILVFLLVTFIPTIAVACRRLQDSDRSGSWIWLYFATLFINLVPVVGSFISLGISILFIVWFAWSGTMGPNRYGPIPSEGR